MLFAKVNELSLTPPAASRLTDTASEMKCPQRTRNKTRVEVSETRKNTSGSFLVSYKCETYCRLINNTDLYGFALQRSFFWPKTGRTSTRPCRSLKVLKKWCLPSRRTPGLFFVICELPSVHFCCHKQILLEIWLILRQVSPDMLHFGQCPVNHRPLGDSQRWASTKQRATGGSQERYRAADHQ